MYILHLAILIIYNLINSAALRHCCFSKKNCPSFYLCSCLILLHWYTSTLTDRQQQMLTMPNKYQHMVEFDKICSDHLYFLGIHVVSKWNWWLIQGSNMLISSASYCTSRHDLPHILHCEDREFLLRVHTDHAVAQPAHRQHCFPWRRNTHFWRPEGRGNHCNYSGYCKDIYSCQKPTLSLIHINFLKTYSK